MDKSTLIKVTNRNNGTTGYELPELNLLRQFQPGEVKEITFEELQRLVYIPGGEYLLQHLLVLDNKDAIKELVGAVEREYFMNKADIEKMLLEGSLDQLLDCLDFAPVGVIELVKQCAIDLQVNDINKRQAIKDKTGFDVTKALEIKAETQEQSEEKEKAPTRRAEEKKEGAPVRRVVATEAP